MEEKNSEKTVNKKAIKIKKNKVTPLYFLLFLVMAAIGYFVYCFYVKFNDIELVLADVRNKRIETVFENKLAYLKKENDKLFKKLENKITKNEHIVQKYDTQLKEISNHSKNIITSKDDVLILEIRSGLHIVSWVLAYSYNMDAAIRLLQSLKQKTSLLTTNITKIRKAITNDIVKLQSLNTLDQVDLFAKIDAAKLLSTNLVIQQSHLSIKNNDEDFVPRQGWRGYLDQIFFIVKKLVVFKRHDKEISPLLSPENRNIIIQNLQLLFNQLQWSVIYRNPQIYKDTINQALDIIRDNFSSDNKLNQNVISILEQLISLNISRDIPELDSIKEINKMFPIIYNKT